MSSKPPDKPQSRPPTFFSSLASRFLDYLSTLAPHFTPILVCLLFVPLIIAVSLFAGFLVWKNAAVGFVAPVYLQYGDGPQPYAHIALPPLTPRQPYDISLHLVVPATETNFALGNFMTNLRLRSSSNYTLATVRKPAMIVPPKKSLLRSPSSTVSVDIQLLPYFSYGTSSVTAEIQLGREDSWKSVWSGQGRELSVLSASLTGVVVHQGFRGIITRFPLLSAIAASITFLSIVSTILGACLLPSVLHGATVWLGQEGKEEGTDEEEREWEKMPIKSESESDSDLKLGLQTTQARQRRSRPMMKKEHRDLPAGEAQAMPSAGGAETPLRRRTSRRRSHSPPLYEEEP